MNQKGFTNIVLVIIGIVILAGAAGYFVLTPKPITPPQEDQGGSEPQMALAPYIDVEAVVSSLFLDDLYSDCKTPEACPRDRATLRVDKIDRVGDPDGAIDLNIGDQIEFHLKYSARAAKLRPDVSPTCRQGEVFKSGSCVAEGCEGPKCTASSPSYAEKQAEIEDGYIVYHLPERKDEVSDKILPGLEKDSKIKIRIWQPTLLSGEIGEYEIIP